MVCSIKKIQDGSPDSVTAPAPSQSSIIIGCITCFFSLNGALFLLVHAGLFSRAF